LGIFGAHPIGFRLEHRSLDHERERAGVGRYAVTVRDHEDLLAGDK
jgi:hypothetical protein